MLHNTDLTDRNAVRKLVIALVPRGPGSAARAIKAIRAIDDARVAAGGTLCTLAATAMIFG